MMMRQSIAPTYDKRETGERFTIETRECGSRMEIKALPDPFVNHTVHVRGWRNALKVLRGRYSLTMVVGGDRDIVEDVLELDDDYRGQPRSSRRREFDEGMQRALGDFAAQAGEHEL